MSLEMVMVVKSGESVLVKWITSTETNNDFFTIEKSIDQNNWITVSTVEGAGTSISELEYRSVDYTPFAGTSYYRLKQTDFDGKYSYSNVKSVIFEKEKNEYLVYPIPAREYINIDSKNNEVFTYELYDLKGQRIIVPESTDFQKAKLFTKNLKSGLYILIINDSSGTETIKISINN